MLYFILKTAFVLLNTMFSFALKRWGAVVWRRLAFVSVCVVKISGIDVVVLLCSKTDSRLELPAIGWRGYSDL